MLIITTEDSIPVSITGLIEAYKGNEIKGLRDVIIPNVENMKNNITESFNQLTNFKTYTKKEVIDAFTENSEKRDINKNWETKFYCYREFFSYATEHIDKFSTKILSDYILESESDIKNIQYILRGLENHDQTYEMFTDIKELIPVSMFDCAHVLSDEFKANIVLFRDYITEKFLNNPTVNEYINTNSPSSIAYFTTVCIMVERIINFTGIMLVVAKSYVFNGSYDGSIDRYYRDIIAVRKKYNEYAGVAIASEAESEIPEQNTGEETGFSDNASVSFFTKFKDKYKSVRENNFKRLKIFTFYIGRKADAGFFKKYLGRIPHMYSNYAGEAEMKENRMTGDPTEIITTGAPNYIRSITEELCKLNKEMYLISTKMAEMDDAQILNIAQKYLTTFKINVLDPKHIENIDKMIVKETKFRIAQVLLGNHNVYGYTPQSVTETDKFPPPNLIVVSLFVENPHHKPEMLKVSEIFKSGESISFFADPTYVNNISALYKETMLKITNDVTVTNTLNTVRMANKSFGKYKMNMKLKLKSNVSADDGKKMKENIKYSKKVVKGFQDSMLVIYDHKHKILDCIEMFLNITVRISNLAKKCVESMLIIEQGASDKDFDSKKQKGYTTGDKVKASTLKKIAPGEDTVNGFDEVTTSKSYTVNK